MIKRSICFLFLIMTMLTGYTDQPAAGKNISHAAVLTNKINNKSIPFKYAFTGFVSVKDVINDLPTGIMIFNTQDEWTKFASEIFPYDDIPLPVYSGGIDFSKDSFVYYSKVDAKADFYSKAWQIDTISLDNHRLNINTKDLDGKLTITANNSEKSDKHRYVILITIDKRHLSELK